MNKVELCLYPKWPWSHNMMLKVMKLLLNGDDTTDGDDVVGDIADVCDVNGDEDDDELRNFSACIRDDLGPTQDNITSGPSHVRHLCCLNNEKTYAGQKSLHREILTE